MSAYPPDGSNSEVASASRQSRARPADGTAHIQLQLSVPGGSRLRLTIEARASTAQAGIEAGTALPGGQDHLQEPAGRGRYWSNAVVSILGRSTAWAEEAVAKLPFSLGILLFGLALTIYLATRFIGLADFPIYFFSDEAIQSMVASDFLRDGFRNYDHELLPTYFQNVDKYSLGITVYLQILPNLVLGRTIWTVRGLVVLVTLLAAVAVGLTLRDVFKTTYWWAGTLLLSTAPAWFLHSRTAFETAVMASFYAGGLYFYLLYRTRSPRFLYLSLVLFALSFYTYSPAQLIVPLTGGLLFFSDLRYHWQNRRVVLRGLILFILLGLPYLRFRLGHPAAVGEYLSMLSSYWAQPLSLPEKLARFTSQYAYLISPFYWFVPNQYDASRHLMRGYGHLHWSILPFFALGIWMAIRNFRDPTHRVLLACLLAAPSAAALVEVPSSITRCLVLVIPAVLLAGIGLERTLAWLEGRSVPRIVLSFGVFFLLTAFNLAMLSDALRNGPTWFRNYSLDGMQYGAQQVFSAIQDHLRQDPQADITLSPNWSFGTHELARFFLKEPVPIRIGSIENFLSGNQPLGPHSLLVLPPTEYQQAIRSGKFTGVQVAQTISYPDGTPGFYLVHMAYVEDIAAIVAREMDEQLRLQPGEIVLDEQAVRISYSPLDIGPVENAFDGNPASLIRSLAANPVVIEMIFPRARSFHGLELLYGTTAVEVTVKFYANEFDPEPVLVIGKLDGTLTQPQTMLDFGRSFIAQKVRLEIRDRTQSQPGHVHLWEIRLR